MELSENVVVVTGGGSGLGAQTARYLSEQGARIALFDTNMDSATRVAKEIRAEAFECDVTNSNAAELAFTAVTQKLGPPRICINCAGIAPGKRIVGRDGPMPLHDFEKVIQINLLGTFNILRLAAAIMSKLEPLGGEDQERGIIINTASVAAFEGQMGQAAYSASKGGVCSLTLPAARELAQFNIRVVTIAPGLFQTPLVETFTSEVQQNLIRDVPYPKRFGKPNEYAMLVEQIIKNSFLNGCVLRLDGALRMQAK